MEALCFFAGIALAITGSYSCYCILLISVVFYSVRLGLGLFCLGVVWALIHNHIVADQRMPSALILNKAQVVGVVHSIPSVINEGRMQFQFLIHELNQQKVRALVLLTCYQACPKMQVGELWQLVVKLKRTTAPGNPGGRDYQTYLIARHIHWNGYVQGKNYSLLETRSKNALLHLREYLSQLMEKSFSDKNSLGIYQALTIGMTNHIQKSQWELFRRTGTTHLMVISGAHIGLVATMIFGFWKRLWTINSQLCLFCPAQKPASLAAFVAAFIYSLLAGFAVPAQRAMIACALVFIKNFINKRFTGWQAWRYALFLVLFIEPHAVLLPGFYLSFLAVAILISVSQRYSYYRGFKKILLLQLACLFGLMPFTLYWFSYGALNGLLANLIAIPLVGYVIVPLSLVNLITESVFHITWCSYPLDWSIKLLLFYLSWIDQLAFLNFTFYVQYLYQILALVLALILLCYFPEPRFYFSCMVLLMASFFPYHEQPRRGHFRVHVLDVGQGLSVAVRTQHHLLIYDTGVKFYQGSDMGQLVIVPFLHIAGLKKIDKLVISHPDLDHRGGLASIIKEIPTAELIVNDQAFYQHGKNCHNYPAWHWDGVDFQFLPIRAAFREKNNLCCVLKITNHQKSLLLPGDIEAQAEAYLYKNYFNALASSFLVVPHHGSRTSSSPAFIRAVGARYAVISAAFDNRFHFPHQETIRTLRHYHTHIYNTMSCGMVTWDSEKNQPPQCYRPVG